MARNTTQVKSKIALMGTAVFPGSKSCLVYAISEKASEQMASGDIEIREVCTVRFGGQERLPRIHIDFAHAK